MTPNGRKQTIGKKQRTQQYLEGKAMVYLIIKHRNKLELLVCFTKNCEQNYLGG